MRRKALLGVVAAATLPLLTTASFSQTPAPAPRPAVRPATPPVLIDPRWRVEPTPAPVQPQVTPPVTRGYTQFDLLIEPREWPRDDDINRQMPETPGERQDDDFGLDSPPAYDATHPNDPLGPD